jgi:linoleoyl-CoA desaturase
MITPKFAHSSLSIHAELKSRVNDHFEKRSINPTGNRNLYAKAFVLLAGYIAVYIHLVFFTPIAWIAVPECIMLGLLTSGIGFNIMHDGSHGSFSKNKWLNRAAALTLDLLGASSVMWKNKHNLIHHTYTNIHGVDDDIEAKPFLRLAPTQKHYKWHKYQHLYFWFLYGLLYLFWIFFTDYKKYFSSKVGNVPIKKLDAADHIFFWFFKALHFFMYILLPIRLCGLVPWLCGFFVYTFTTGVVLSMVFQLAHTVEETSFPVAIQPANKMEDEWAMHQLRTTANFATDNKIITWFVGGLNFQVEHHLFPKISHAHYPDISKIIKNACREMNVPYLEHLKMADAIASHVAHPKKMGEYVD